MKSMSGDSMSDDIRIYVLPLSGGMLVCQTSILCLLCDAGIVPDICMGTSGGNVVGYLGLASGWRTNEILVKCRDLNAEIFLRPWIHQWFPAIGCIPFFGTMYRRGYGASKLLHNWFTKSMISRKTEMWTSAFNEDTFRSRMFCNKTVRNALLKPVVDINGIDTPMYVGNDLHKLATISSASASIPFVVEPPIIDGNSYVDGGTVFSSPLPPLSSSIIKLFKSNPRKLMRMYYISPYNVSTYSSPKSFRQPIDAVLNSLMIHDQKDAITVLSLLGSRVSCSSHVGVTNLNIIDEVARGKHCVVIISPVVEHEIDKTSFTGDDVVEAVIDGYKSGAILDIWTSFPM